MLEPFVEYRFRVFMYNNLMLSPRRITQSRFLFFLRLRGIYPKSSGFVCTRAKEKQIVANASNGLSL